MFKSVFSIISLFLFFSPSSFASSLSGLNLLPAANASLQEASVEIDDMSVFAWQAQLDGQSEILVDVLSVDDLRLGYGCHLHGKSIACHEEEQAQGNKRYRSDEEVTLEFMQKGNLVALKKFEKVMKRKGKDLGVLTSYKVWTHKDHHSSGHGAGTDVWTKINFSIDGVAGQRFVLCHVHGGESDFVCHFGLAGKGEPNISL